jgi:hypothetical protein
LAGLVCLQVVLANGLQKRTGKANDQENSDLPLDVVEEPPVLYPKSPRTPVRLSAGKQIEFT